MCNYMLHIRKFSRGKFYSFMNFVQFAKYFYSPANVSTCHSQQLLSDGSGCPYQYHEPAPLAIQVSPTSVGLAQVCPNKSTIAITNCKIRPVLQPTSRAESCAQSC